ncbi:MAG: DUF1800 family protein, partial [Candidatus Brocadiae bacterium]|nr:DUF1800 family protein [Candidatus Brocadiia bacterium]
LAPALLKGRTLGYARIRGLKAGRTTLSIGDASLEVEVLPRRTPVERRVTVVGPADGASVWRTFSVGVEVDAEAAGEGAVHELRLSNGETLTPRRVSGPWWGPTLRVLYAVNTFSFRAGPLDLTAVVRRADGTEIAGEPRRVTVLRPAGDDLVELEAEDQRELLRPRHLGPGNPTVLVDAKASGHECYSMFSGDPAAVFPFEVEKAGTWQIIANVRGTFAGGAFPTLGLSLDDSGTHLTNAPLVDENWHRIALGVPIRIEAGKRFLVLRFLNDFYAPSGNADRNMFLDRIELVRVEKTRAGGSEGSDPGGPVAMGGGEAKRRSSWGDVRVAFAESFDGQPAPGIVEIGGVCWWRRMDKTAAPLCTLYVNGKAQCGQRSAAPKWWLDCAHLQDGDNELKIVAVLDGGETAETPVQRLAWRPPWERAGRQRPAREFRRFTVRDTGWNRRTRDLLNRGTDSPEKICALMGGPETAVLTLPEDLAGSFNIWVEGRGYEFQGQAVAKVELEAGGGKTEIGSPQMPGWWSPVQAGAAILPRGRKKLHVTFANDRYEEGKGDRNLALQSVMLISAPAGKDGRSPRSRVLWPPADAEVWEQDVVVLEAADDTGVAWVELEIDGRRTGIRADIPGRIGRVVLPLPARGLAPGPHTLTIAGADNGGLEGISAPRTFVVPAAPPADPGRYRRAVHLLNRFAYGPDPAELADVLLMGEEPWLADRLSRRGDDPGDVNALTQACIVFNGQNGAYDVMARDAMHACLTPNPARTRFVRWVDNHFSTWIRKTQERNEWEERRTFTMLGVAPFRDLLGASSHSPCMLVYLDQSNSFARALNENYAREILELHTVGVHGGYTQADVTSLAHLLTGWMTSNEGDGQSGGPLLQWTFRFDPNLNDDRPHRFFGMTFPKAGPEARYDRARLAVELLAAHPSTATFVCSKLVAHYAAWPADPEMTADLARVFLETDGDLRAVLLALSRHPGFWRPALEPRIAPPFDTAVRISRATRHALPWQVLDLCARSGAGVYDRPTPDGYQEEDAAWTSTNALLQRWRFARENEWAIATLVPGVLRWTGTPATDDIRDRIIDIVAIRITGRVLSPSSHDAVLGALRTFQGNRDELAQSAASLVAQMPEAQTR